MVLYDISMTIEPGMAVYKNKAEKKPQIETVQNFNEGSVFESRLGIDLHTGTHLDLPLHMIPAGGDSGLWTPDNMFTACIVLDYTDLASESVSAGDLEQKEEIIWGYRKPASGLAWTVLLKTKNSLQEEFDFSFTYLDRTGASYLAEKELAGIGIDALGIERNQPNHETHKTLLGAGLWILEGLRLAEVPEGKYMLAVMPLKIKGVEALPARAALLNADIFLANK